MITVKETLKKYNIVMLEVEFFKTRSCEYYLHFNINLLHPEKLHLKKKKPIKKYFKLFELVKWIKKVNLFMAVLLKIETVQTD